LDPKKKKSLLTPVESIAPEATNAKYQNGPGFFWGLPRSLIGLSHFFFNWPFGPLIIFCGKKCYSFRTLVTSLLLFFPDIIG